MLLQAGSILSYSTNVHPGENLAGVCRVLAEDVVRVRDAVCPGRRFGVELRLGGRAAAEIFPDHSLAPVPERVSSIQKVLTDNNLFLFSLNAFPLRDFHQAEVKRDVYLPDWTERARIDTTVQLCRLLAELLPEGIDGTVSTAPGGFKDNRDRAALAKEYAEGFAEAVGALKRLRDETGKTIILAPEPEPFCFLETVDEFADFYRDAFLPELRKKLVADGSSATLAEETARRHFGINLDACHLAVEFENPAEAVAKLLASGITIAKVHISSAARVRNPFHNPGGMEKLAKLAEPRYLHQTFARDGEGKVIYRYEDLPEFLRLDKNELKQVAEVRTHFHLPLFGDCDGELATTSDVTRELLREIMSRGLRPHLATETYTWPLLDAGGVHEGIARELLWTIDALGTAC
jgi:sugar phosphate isomerase/epimerase